MDNNPVQKLGETLQEIARLKDDVARLEGVARALYADVGVLLGVESSIPAASNGSSAAASPGKSGRKPRKGGTSDRQRVVQVIGELGPARLEEISKRLDESGHPVPATSIRSYLTRGARDGQLVRLSDGLYALVDSVPQGEPALDLDTTRDNEQ